MIKKKKKNMHTYYTRYTRYEIWTYYILYNDFGTLNCSGLLIAYRIFTYCFNYSVYLNEKPTLCSIIIKVIIFYKLRKI